LELIFVGRLQHIQKGILWLPDILKACRNRGVDAGLTVVGDGPDAAGLEREFSDHGLAGQVRRLKGLSPEQVYTQLLNAHILLMPSQYEGLPIALLESQACGCVPIVSLLPGITDTVVTHGETGMLVDVGDVAGIADAIVTLHRDPALWSRMSAAGRERIAAEFSVQRMGDSYLHLIGEVMQGRYPLPRSRALQPALNVRVFPWREFLPGWLRQIGRRGRRWLAKSSASPEGSSGREAPGRRLWRQHGL
jgi:glycosyltransferase involved in cell wall biosynthesis